MIIVATIFIIISLVLSVTLSILINKNYKKGYEFGNSLSKETMERYKKISDENVKLKERDVVLSDIAIKHFALIRKNLLESPEEVVESIEQYDERARKEAFGEYGDMFEKELKEMETTGGEKEFSTKNNAK